MTTIQKLIHLSGMTQREFAQAVGEDESNISRYANGKRNISLDKFLEWCERINFNQWQKLFSK